MQPKDILTTNRPPSIIEYGEAGSGKTALVAQASNAYMFDFDDGMRTAAKLEDKFFKERQSIEFDIYKELNPKAPCKYHEARVKLMQIMQEVRTKKWEHDAIVIDSLTGLSKSIMMKVMKDEAADALAKPQRNHWGSMVNYMEAFLATLRSIPVLTIVTAHVNSFEDEDGTVLGFFPSSITRNHGKKSIPWMFDEVWYASRKPEGSGNLGYYVDGDFVYKYMTRSRSNFGKVKHNEIGLRGLLEKVGYTYK